MKKSFPVIDFRRGSERGTLSKLHIVAPDGRLIASSACCGEARGGDASDGVPMFAKQSRPTANLHVLLTRKPGI